MMMINKSIFLTISSTDDVSHFQSLYLYQISISSNDYDNCFNILYPYQDGQCVYISFLYQAIMINVSISHIHIKQ